MPIVDEFITAISLAEEHVRKVMNVSSIYVFRTWGKNVLGHGMFVFQPSLGARRPTSVSIYLLSNGSLVYVLSISRTVLERYINVRQDKPVIVLLLDFYNPPCVTSMIPVCSLAELLERAFPELANLDKLAQIYRETQCCIEVSDYPADYAYLIFSSSSLDPRRIALYVVALCVAKLVLEGEINPRKAAQVIDKLEEVQVPQPVE